MNHPHELKNKLNKEQAMAKIAAEDFSRKTISFYRYVKIENPRALRDELFVEWEKLGCLGRIYIAKEGINAQMNVPEPVWEKFVEALYGYEVFKDVPFKHAVEDPAESFWKLTMKVKEKIVADGIDDPTFDASDVGTHLNAEQFNQKLEDPNTVCVDMRNFYESEVGHFEGAITPDCATFREELPMVVDELKGQEDKEVIMYCTGGIRCEKASSYLRHHGFKNVSQLHGGIIQYAHEIKQKGLESKFKGKNFVFDDRPSERITDDILSCCHQCGASCDDHVNCANEGCNLLFIQCRDCAAKFHNCCGKACEALALLPEAERRKARAGKEKEDPLALGRNPFRRPKPDSAIKG